MRSQTRAYLYAIAAVLCWSTVASAFKLTLDETGVGELLLLSTWASLAVLLLVMGAQRSFTQWKSWSRREWGHSAILGALNPFLYYLVLFRAYDLLRAQEAQPLNYTWPIVLVLLSAVVFRQRLHAYTIAAMLVSFAGVLVISTRGDVTGLRFTSTEGVLLAVGSSLLWATSWILNMRSRAAQVPKLAANFLFGALYVATYVLLSHDHAAITAGAVVGGVYVGIFEMGLTFVFWLRALTLSKSTAGVSNLVYLSPFLSLLFIHVLVGEDIAVSTVLGLVLIVSGIVVQRWGEARGARAPSRQE
ncbi:MAG: DMT family transporter [Bacteroidota bacterium]|jgi:drug/metabolite transporter (DMT)-like permease|nr:DMT family transporter [Bacteroidota bacterium]